MASLEGSAVTIYNGKEANQGNLKAVLDRPDIRDLPLAIVPVAGEFRTGKSFLLSYFLRYLTNKTLGDEDEKLIGFDHKCSSKQVTEGIKIWDQPLIVKGYQEDGSEQKIVVLLMDSQGILGGKGGKEVATRIFALSTMVSSIMIYNLMGQLNEGILGHLELFTSYAKQATATDVNETPFLKLLLLIRDWGKKDDHDYGLKGGNTYVDEYFEDEETKAFDSYFKEIQCYLMPKPGDCVDDKHYNGCLSKLKNIFKKHLQVLTHGLLNYQHLSQNLKKVTGLPITAGQFCDYFEKCTKLMENVDWNKSTTMLKMNAKFNCELAKKAALNCYTAYMERKTASFMIKDKISVMTSDELDNVNNSATQKAQNKFGTMSIFSRKNVSKLYVEYERKLTEELNNLFVGYKQKLGSEKQNRRMKTEKNFYFKLAFMFVCVCAFLFFVCLVLFHNNAIETEEHNRKIREQTEEYNRKKREQTEEYNRKIREQDERIRRLEREHKYEPPPRYVPPPRNEEKASIGFFTTIGFVAGGAIGAFVGPLGGAGGAGLGGGIGKLLDDMVN